MTSLSLTTALLTTTLLCAAAPFAGFAQDAKPDVVETDERLDALEGRLSDTDTKLDTILGLLEQMTAAAPASTAAQATAPSGLTAEPEPAAPAVAPTAPGAALKPGMIVRVAALTEDDLLAVSQATIGVFYTNENEFVIQGYPEKIGFDASTSVGHELRGIIPVHDAGVHTLIVTLEYNRGGNACGVSANISDSSIISDVKHFDGRASFVQPVQLEPGEYNLTIWVACDASTQESAEPKFSVAIVTPASAGPVPLAEVLAVEDRNGL